MPRFRPTRIQALSVAALVLVVQRLGFALLGSGFAGTLFQDTLIVLASTTAAVTCYAAAMRGRGVVRIFWLLFGITFSLQLVGDFSWAWYRHFQIAVPENALFPSIFYRLYVGPMAIALFLPEDLRSSRLESFFDGCVVVGLVVLSMFQLQMTELSAHDPRLWRLITIGTAVNVVLILGAVSRFVFSERGSLRGLFARQAIYLSVYSGTALVTSIGDAYFPDIDASIDLIWIVTYLAGAVLAVTWNPRPAEERAATPRIGRRASLLCFNLTLAAMVLGCTYLGIRGAASTRTVGMVAVSAVLLSYAIRSALMQDNQEKYMVALQESKAQIQHQALHDELTGLPNRRLFNERLSHTLAVAQRERQIVALLYFDLDGFKPVNDRLGHTVGDLLMNRAASRLIARARKSDTLARMGGDEFTLLLSRLPTREYAAQVAKEVLSVLTEPFQIEGHTIRITASMGIGIFPEGAGDAAALIHQADTAMYAVKRSGGNGIRFYTAELG